MHRRSRLILGVMIFALAVLGARGLYAQVDTGTISGTVTDASGAVIPGASVTLINQGTNLKLTTITDSSGGYTFTPIRIGTYTVEASYQGFQQAVHKDILVQVQSDVNVKFALQPGAVTQSVEVRAAPPLLETGSASVGQVVGRQQVNDLPLNGRNYTFLAQLSAGVTVGGQEGRGLNATGDFSANGARPAQNNYLLNGMDDNADLVDFLNGTAYVVRAPVDAIQEFKVQTANYSAEFGRAGGAILNATIKSGTNELHGDAWEFLRNSGLDAANFFENSPTPTPKGEFRLNQFGATLGGPIVIPHIYNGRNKTFFFLDYEGTRIRQATPYVVSVPTVQERTSGFTNFSQLISGQHGTQTDASGSVYPVGKIFDPATTQLIGPNQYIRQPFLNNQIPSSRIDQNVVKLLNLYPLPNAGGSNDIFNNFVSDPVLQDRVDQGDARIDHNFSDRDQMFGDVSFSNEPTLKPGPFAGIADGGGFNQGIQTAATTNDVLSWTHSVSATLINEARIGYSRIGTSRVQPFANTLTDIPGQFGIKGIPQAPLNGGLPYLNFSGVAQLGNAQFLPSVEYNSTVQVTENLTKIYGGHTFKGGFEFQHVKFATLQPPFPRGSFNFNGEFSQVPGSTNGNTGIVDALLIPITATVPNGINNAGGASGVNASNISNTDDGKQYYGLYFQDDWKTTQKLTLNLGFRWDYFGQVYEMFGAQANFIPGPPGKGAQYLIPWERCNRGDISTSFTELTAKDGILVACSGNQSLGNSQLTNFSPRVGLAYQMKPKLVIRAGYGWFYDGFENRGYSPNIGENFPFQFQFRFSTPTNETPIAYANGAVATLGAGLTGVPLVSTAVKANSLALEGIQSNYVTPYTMDYNFSVQYQMTPNQTFEIGYVGSTTRHLETFVGSNEDNLILPTAVSKFAYAPFPDFAYGQSYASTQGNSIYNSLQTTFERRFSGGLNVLADYTYSKCMTDSRDLLNNNQQGYRAPYLANFGIQADYSYCDSDVRNMVHLAGVYQLPFGHGQRLGRNASGVANAIVGGWTANWILTLQDGQPFGVGCPKGTSQFGCNALLVPGQSMISGPHNVNNWLNPAAFAQPPLATTVGTTNYAVLGGAPTQAVGPGFHRMDFSLFKQFQTTERTHLEFRTEVFNIANNPQFALPGFKDFTNPSRFTQITGTRDGAYDQREIQFALKFYW